MPEKIEMRLKHKPRNLGLCFIIWILLPLLTFTACKKEEADLSISKTTISVDSKSGSATARIKSDQK